MRSHAVSRGTRTPLRCRRALLLVALAIGILAAWAASLAYGSNPLSLEQVWRGFLEGLDGPADSEAAIIVWSFRMPRTLAGILTGAAFGVAGALIQSISRNPLADPGILGVNAGAGFAVTLGIGFFGVAGFTGYVPFAFVGATVATVLVILIGGAGRDFSPATMVLAGVALTAVLGGFSTFLALADERTFQSSFNWGIGSIAHVDAADQLIALPLILTGLVIAIAISGPLNTMALGDELAASLGTKIVTVRVLCVLAITLLAGTATALTGGLAFIGLLVPHLVRRFTGPDQRWIIPVSALAAPVIVLAADVLGRVLGSPGEIQVGILTAVLGAPMLIAVARSRKVIEL